MGLRRVAGAPRSRGSLTRACADTYCLRHPPAARRSQPIELRDEPHRITLCPGGRPAGGSLMSALHLDSFLATSRPRAAQFPAAGSTRCSAPTRGTTPTVVVLGTLLRHEPLVAVSRRAGRQCLMVFERSHLTRVRRRRMPGRRGCVKCRMGGALLTTTGSRLGAVAVVGNVVILTCNLSNPCFLENPAGALAQR
jgi:hypothetical protein